MNGPMDSTKGFFSASDFILRWGVRARARDLHSGSIETMFGGGGSKLELVPPLQLYEKASWMLALESQPV